MIPVASLLFTFLVRSVSVVTSGTVSHDWSCLRGSCYVLVEPLGFLRCCKEVNSSTVKHSQFTRNVVESSKVSHSHKLLHNWAELPSNTDRFCRQVLREGKLAVIMYDVSLPCFAVHKLLLLKLQKAHKNSSVLVRFSRC